MWSDRRTCGHATLHDASVVSGCDIALVELPLPYPYMSEQLGPEWASAPLPR